MAVGIAFLAIHLFGLLYGVVLWQRTDVSPLAAGLLIAVVPAFIVTITFEMIGISLTAAAFELPLYAGPVFVYEYTVDAVLDPRDRSQLDFNLITK
ncbi:hypothetical protein ACFQKF_13140 [Halalkalicoccus sp. GCM10025322]|uniref:hypothetical protein n=1 Tax=Halalkalicoccus TaxID=332246 RepID=UPI002F96B1CB